MTQDDYDDQHSGEPIPLAERSRRRVPDSHPSQRKLARGRVNAQAKVINDERKVQPSRFIVCSQQLTGKGWLLKTRGEVRDDRH